MSIPKLNRDNILTNTISYDITILNTVDFHKIAQDILLTLLLLNKRIIYICVNK